MTAEGNGRANDITVANHPEASRYEIRVGQQLAAFAEYRLTAGLIVFTHTEIDPSFEGAGLGSRLAAGALDDVRARGLGGVSHCKFISAFVRRHPEYADLVTIARPRG